MAEPGLRERKKRRTREAILEAAYTLFRESGFDRVSVADIAAAAEVSKPTLFSYFPVKEDLVLRRFVDYGKGPARLIRTRPPGVPALTVLRRNFLDLLDRRDPLTGLNDTPPAVTFHHLLYSTPALMTRLTGYLLDQEQELAAELFGAGEPADEFTAHCTAAQIFATQRILSFYNAREMRRGRSADDVHPEAVAHAETAFDLLENGPAETGTAP